MELAIWILSGVVLILLIWLIASSAVGNGSIKTLQEDLEREQEYRKRDNTYSKDDRSRLNKRVSEQDAAFKALSKLLPGPFALLSFRRSDGYGNDVKQWDKDKIMRLAERVKSESKNGADDKVIEKLEKFV